MSQAHVRKLGGGESSPAPSRDSVDPRVSVPNASLRGPAVTCQGGRTISGSTGAFLGSWWAWKGWGPDWRPHAGLWGQKAGGFTGTTCGNGVQMGWNPVELRLWP